VKGSREGVEEALRDGDTHYGVNTGFGAVQLPDILDNVEQGLAIKPLTAA
jgi:histidine ammonia-lyase